MNATEALLVEVMDVIARRFDKHAVLRGGMVLRVLGCERLTNDVAYVFVPFASKNDIVQDILGALHDIVRHLVLPRMGVRPDQVALEKRLALPCYSRLVQEPDHFTGRTAEEFFEFLRQATFRLDDRMIAEELGDYLPVEELAGLAMRFRAELAGL